MTCLILWSRTPSRLRSFTISATELDGTLPAIDMTATKHQTKLYECGCSFGLETLSLLIHMAQSCSRSFR